MSLKIDTQNIFYPDSGQKLFNLSPTKTLLKEPGYLDNFFNKFKKKPKEDHHTNLNINQVIFCNDNLDGNDEKIILYYGNVFKCKWDKSDKDTQSNHKSPKLDIINLKTFNIEENLEGKVYNTKELMFKDDTCKGFRYHYFLVPELGVENTQTAFLFKKEPDVFVNISFNTRRKLYKLDDDQFKNLIDQIEKETKASQK